MSDRKTPTPPKVILEGIVHKKSPKDFGGFTFFQERYFVLTQESLTYYKKKTEYVKSPEKARGVLLTDGIKKINAMANTVRFSLLLKGDLGRTFELKAVSKSSQAQWTRRLREIVAKNNFNLERDDEDLTKYDDPKFWKPDVAKQIMKARRRQAVGGRVVSKSSEGKDTTKDQAVIDKILSLADGISFMKTFSKEDRLRLVQEMWKETFEAKSVIAACGTQSNKFYIISSGAVSITNSIEDGVEDRARLNPWETFGENSLTYRVPFTATYSAEVATECWIVNRESYKAIQKDIVESRSALRVKFLKKTTLLGSLGGLELNAIAEALETKTFSDGVDIITQGDEGDVFFIVSKGECVVKKDGIEVHRYQQAGDYFGERALLKNTVRAATVTAVGEVEILCIGRKDFNTYIGSLEKLMARIQSYSDKPSRIKSDTVVKLEGLSMKEIDDRAGANLENPQLSDFKEIGTLGRGTFGIVKLVQGKEGHTYALKAVNKAYVAQHGQQSHLVDEKKTMMMLKHPFLVRLYGTMRDRNYVYFILEPSLGGELFTLLQDKGTFDESVCKFYGACVISAFEYIHRKNIIYRDLKPENLLLTENGYLKVVDFGFAKIIEPSKRTFTFCGTPDYLAPEIVRSSGHNFGVDWWTVGIFCFEMIAGTTPFYDDRVDNMYANIIKGNLKFPPFGFSLEAKNFIKSLLTLKPHQRLGVKKGGAKLVKEHPWFKGFDWTALVEQRLPAPYPMKVKSTTDLSNFETYDDESMSDHDYETDEEDPDWDKAF